MLSICGRVALTPDMNFSFCCMHRDMCKYPHHDSLMILCTLLVGIQENCWKLSMDTFILLHPLTLGDVNHTCYYVPVGCYVFILDEYDKLHDVAHGTGRAHNIL